MKRYTIAVDGQIYAAVLNLPVMERLNDLAGKEDPTGIISIDDILKVCSSVSTCVEAAAAMISEGEALEGRPGEYTADWIKARLEPGDLPRIQRRVMGIAALAMQMETDTGEEDEVDEVLEGIKKKDATAR